MRIHFQAVPWDLYAALAFVLAVSSVLLLAGAGNPFGILLLIWIPGYLATAVLLPKKGETDVIHRAALSLGLSFALAAFAGLVLAFAPWGVTFLSAVIAIEALSIALGVAAYARRLALPPEERLELSLTVRVAGWSDYTLVEKILAVALAVILVVAVPFLALALTEPRATQPFSELYLLGSTGNFTDYPTLLNVSKPGSVFVEVSNHEAATMNYTLRVDLVGVRIVYNATTGGNESLELNRTTWSWFNSTLADGATWTLPYTFTIPAPGTWEVQFLLYRGGDLATFYLHADLLVRVV